ncbi:hypothetical protein V6R21_13285 [Limibacter armeniacum]|uniref:hypothetical protein n=1 Tax=Limibacter armeniacum TaxID=466084 RepID=UPI002FE6A7E0
MGDRFIRICPEKEVTAPKEKAQKILKWLHSENLFSEDLSDCVYGGLGYRPKENLEHYIVEKGEALDVIDNQFGGLIIEYERMIYDGYQYSALLSATCPKCNKDYLEGIDYDKIVNGELEGKYKLDYEYVSGCVDSWMDNPEATILCKNCKTISRVVDFEFQENMCLTNLSFTFWHILSLNDQFLLKFEEILDEKVVKIFGKL